MIANVDHFAAKVLAHFAKNPFRVKGSLRSYTLKCKYSEGKTIIFLKKQSWEKYFLASNCIIWKISNYGFTKKMLSQRQKEMEKALKQSMQRV